MLESVLNNTGLGINAKKCLYEGVIVPTMLYGAETCGMRSTKRRKDNIFEIIFYRFCEVWWESPEWADLRMERCIEELEYKGSWRVEWIREY